MADRSVVHMAVDGQPLGAARRAGATQGCALVVLACLPTMAIVSLVPNLSLLLEHFASVPHSQALVPMLLTIPSLCIAVTSPAVGVLLDRWGRRRLLAASLVVFTVVGTAPYFLSDFHLVLLTRFPVGIAEAGILAAQSALLGDYFEGNARQKWLGTTSFIGPIVAVGLMLMGGYLGGISWRAPFLMYLLGVPTLVWALSSLYEPGAGRFDLAGRRAPAEPFPWRTALVVSLATVGLSIIYFVQGIQLGRVFGDLGVRTPEAISRYVMIANVGVVLGGLVYPRFGNLTTHLKFAAVLVCDAIGYAGLGLAHDAPTALPAALLAQFGNGLTFPLLIGWSLQRFPQGARGRGMGLFVGCFFAGTFLSPLAVMWIEGYSGSFLSALFVVSAICLAAIVGLFAAGAVRRGWDTFRPRADRH